MNYLPYKVYKKINEDFFKKCGDPSDQSIRENYCEYAETLRDHENDSDHVHCPYCGDEEGAPYSYIDEVYEDGSTEVHCGCCEKEYVLTWDATLEEYEAKAKKCETLELDHIWEMYQKNYEWESYGKKYITNKVNWYECKICGDYKIIPVDENGKELSNRYIKYLNKKASKKPENKRVNPIKIKGEVNFSEGSIKIKLDRNTGHKTILETLRKFLETRFWEVTEKEVRYSVQDVINEYKLKRGASSLKLNKDYYYVNIEKIVGVRTEVLISILKKLFPGLTIKNNKTSDEEKYKLESLNYTEDQCRGKEEYTTMDGDFIENGKEIYAVFEENGKVVRGKAYRRSNWYTIVLVDKKGKLIGYFRGENCTYNFPGRKGKISLYEISRKQEQQLVRLVRKEEFLKCESLMRQLRVTRAKRA